MEHLKKGDIVFNARQTSDLLSAGKTSSYARALSSGTVAALNGHKVRAYISGSGLRLPSSSGSMNWSGGNSASGGKLSTGSTENKKIDYVEIALSRIETLISRLTDIVSSSFKKVETKLSASNSAIDETIKQIDAEQKAYNTYIRAANGVGLHESLAVQVREGNLYNIGSYDEDDSKKIEEYKKWYEKALDCAAAVDKLHESLAELYKGQFDNIQKDFENQLSVLESSAKKTTAEISKIEANGYTVTSKYYERQKEEQSSTIELLQKQLEAMQEAFKKAMDSGEIDENSDAYYDMANAIEDVKDKISDAELEIINLDNSIRQLKWDTFDKLIDRIELVNDEADFLVGLLEDAKLYDENGNINENGEAAIGLRLQRYSAYLAESERYAEEIKAIEEEIAKDPYNQDLIDRKNDLVKSQQDSIQSAIDEKDAIKDLINDGIDEEIDHLDDLIDKYTDALDAQKDLYEYSNKVKDQTDDIAKLRKQIAAYKDNTSEDAKSKVQKWEVDLKKAEQELQETQYDRFVSDQKKMLGDLVDDYEKSMNDRMDDINALIADLCGTVNDNSSRIHQTIKDIADKYGYTISDETENVWKSNGKVIADYGDRVSGSLTSIDGMVSTIANDLATMIRQLDSLAGTNEASPESHATGAKSIQTSGLAWTQEHGIPEAIMRKSDGALLTGLNAGDSVFSGAATENLWNFANAPSEFLYSHLARGYSPTVTSGVGTSVHNSTQLDNVNLVLPNVKNYDEFIAEMQKDKRFERMVQAMTFGVATGKSSFGKYNV